MGDLPCDRTENIQPSCATVQARDRDARPTYGNPSGISRDSFRFPLSYADVVDHASSQRGLFLPPGEDTPGCTTQACGVRDRTADYEAAGAKVVGISPDPVGAVKKFDEKHSLGFTLLADEAHSVAEEWGVWGEKNMYGKKYWGVQRATFILDPHGKVARVFPKVSPKTHDDQVLGALAELQAAA
jgi:thioredoxin-dependent peroxiredoxin